MRTRTYAEENATWIYDWDEIANRIEKGEWTKKEKAEWARAAYSWKTCACGNQSDLIPRDTIGSPLDPELLILGSDFPYYLVKAFHAPRYVSTVRDTLRQIERISKAILEELQS